MSEVQLFLKDVATFQEVSPSQATELIEERNGSIIFIGRESCPYCRRFVPKLAQVARTHKLTVYFLHSQQASTLDEVQSLRQKYGVPTVPGLIYSNSDEIRVKCDSSMTEAEILAFVTA